MFKKLLAFITVITLILSQACGVIAIAENDSHGAPHVRFEVEEGLSAEEYNRAKREFGEEVIAARSAVPAMFSRRALVSGNKISNEYIEFAVGSDGRFTVGTVEGNPAIPTDDNQIMLFGHDDPWSSYTTVCVNGSSHIYGDGGFFTSPYFDGDANYSEAVFGDVRVQQIISIVENNSTHRDDIVEIKYVATNTGSSTASFGLRIMMDTMLGSNDAAPFRIPGYGDLITEKEFVGDDIPLYWQAFDDLNSPKVVSHGNFVSGAIHPNKVQFTNWGRVYDTTWGYNVSDGRENGDSAVSVIWERTLPAGAEETYVTRYGLSELLQDLQPPLGLTIASGSSVMTNAAKDDYLPYPITIYVQNVGAATAQNVSCKIELPQELAFADAGETGVVSLGSLGVGEVRTVEKTVYVKGVHNREVNTQFNVSVTATNAETKRLTKQLTIGAIEEGAKAIIIVPGIAGSRLYADQNVNTEDYLSGIVDEFQSGKNEYFVFNKGRMLWEPLTSTTSNKIESITTNQNLIQSEVLMIQCNSNGDSVISIKTDAPGDDVYGAQNTYENLVNTVADKYGSNYDVFFFSYDWRMPNQESAKALEKFINDHRYSDVTLVCHSMGGLVASEYLSRSPNNQSKVNKLITLGTPYLGAPKALYVFETGHFLDWASSTFCMATPLKLVSGNINGIYQLLPDEKYFSLNDTTYVKYYNNNGFWGKHTEERLNYSRTTELIKNRSWSRTSMMTKANDLYDDLFLSNGAHIISTVDSYVVIGYGKDTIMEVVEEYNKDGSFEECRDVVNLNGGDGTVPVISANIGGLTPRDQTYYIKEDHSALAKNSDVIKLVCNIIDGNPNTYNSDKITKNLDAQMNEKGWWILPNLNRIKIKLECPVTLSLLDNDGDVYAYVSENLILNENSDRATVYVMGKDNSTKVAYLTETENAIVLTGTDDGFMDYTVSLMEAGYETKRIVFQDVPVTSSTRIYTDTDLNNGIVLRVDQDNDGDIDIVINPDEVLVGSDLENPKVPVAINKQPEDQFVVVGQRATFSIGATGDNVTYQWYINRNKGNGWRKIDGAVGATYITSVTDLDCDGFKYYCKVTDQYGNTINSNEAVLHVTTAPVLPETGDSSTPMLWLAMSMLSMLGILLMRKKAYSK